jgi:hypothetical protein
MTLGLVRLKECECVCVGSVMTAVLPSLGRYAMFSITREGLQGATSLGKQASSRPTASPAVPSKCLDQRFPVLLNPARRFLLGRTLKN